MTTALNVISTDPVAHPVLPSRNKQPAVAAAGMKLTAAGPKTPSASGAWPGLDAAMMTTPPHAPALGSAAANARTNDGGAGPVQPVPVTDLQPQAA